MKGVFAEVVNFDQPEVADLSILTAAMACTLCQSSNQAEFTAEVMVHFNGIGNIDNPGVLVCPKVSVCLDCGFAGFAVPETELRVLANGIEAAAA